MDQNLSVDQEVVWSFDTEHRSFIESRRTSCKCPATVSFQCPLSSVINEDTMRTETAIEFMVVTTEQKVSRFETQSFSS
jgi:hypothetical protein